MPIFSSLWDTWSHMFSAIPYGDPWVASFAAVFMMIFVGKTIKSIMGYS